MSLDNKKSHVLIMPYGMYCNYDLFLKEGYSHLADEPKVILYIAPSYNYCTAELMTFTPLEFAQLENFANFDCSFLDKLELKRNIERETLAFEREELLCPHIKFLRKYMKDFKCFPLFYNDIKYGVIKSIVEEYWGKCLFVFLTTLSIGMDYNDARRADEYLAEEIEHGSVGNLSHMDFSAFKILPEILEFCRINNFVFRRIALQNSGEVSNNMATTTGYGAWYLDEHVK